MANRTAGSHSKTSRHRSRRRLWVKGKYLLVAILFLQIIVSAGYYLHLRFQLSDRMTQRAVLDKQLIGELKLESDEKLRQLARFIASTNELNDALRRQNANALIDRFNPYWNNMQYEWNLERVDFFLSGKSALASWSARPSSPDQEQRLFNFVDQARNNQQPKTFIACHDHCSVYLISLLDISKSNQAVLVLASSLLDLTRRFRTLTNQGIGILAPIDASQSSDDPIVSNWEYQLQHLTDPAIYKPILDKMSSEFNLVSSIEQSHTSSNSHGDFMISLLPLTREDDSFVVVIRDTSQALQEIYQQTLTFSAVLLAVLLSMPIVVTIVNRRAQWQADEIDAREIVESTEWELSEEVTDTEPGTLPPIDDENHTPVDIDLTNQSVSSISDRLNELKQYNEDINQVLARQMVTLGKERDQIRKVLDNTQAIIMTLTKEGTIKSINRFGEKLTGFREHELIGKSFIDLYPEKVPFALNDLQTMSAIALGEQESFRHEARITCTDGKEKIILWFHARLSPELNHDTPLLSTGIDITENKQLEKNLSWLADHDSLTSLFNRRRFESELKDALDWSQRHQATAALLYIDLDNFKDVNDSCGHHAGDIILRNVANSLQKLTDEIDSSAHQVTARLGGDEFAIIVRNIDEEGIHILSRRILDALFQIRHNQSEIRFQLSCSIGVIMFPEEPCTLDEVLSNADFAMYQAKLLGRNQFYMFDPDDSYREQLHHRILWREKLEAALSEKRFVLHYQPILDISTRTISHYETLVRMIDEEGSIISPGLFINVAERLGLIQQLDHFILDSAIAKQGELQARGLDITLAINLSPRAFDNPDLINNIRSAINQFNARAENLIFEITETAAVTDMSAAEKIMTQIQHLGCRFALDDFGIGFSSFYYLRELPVDYVKIDGSFVNDLPNNSDNEVLVRALSEVAIGFNKLSVAEFVDSLQTLNILSEAKVNYAQGYFIGKPSEKIPVDPPNFYQASREENTAII